MSGNWTPGKLRKRLPGALARARTSGHAFVQISEQHYRLAGIDWWPYTGYWRIGKWKGRGIGSLLNHIEHIEKMNHLLSGTDYA